MITDRKSYKEYVAADLAEAYVPRGVFKRWLKTLGGNEQCAAYRYVHRMRKTEYCLNTGKRWQYYWHKILLTRLGLKLGIRIAPNKVGKGLNIIHLAGGGRMYPQLFADWRLLQGSVRCGGRQCR